MENQKGKSQNTYPSALFQVATPVMAAIPVWLPVPGRCSLLPWSQFSSERPTRDPEL